jgi:hypothetical protein
MKSKVSSWLFFVLALLVMLSCNRSPEPEQIIFLGHPYDWQSEGKRIDPRLEKIPYDTFDMVWLGGDVCGRLTQDSATLLYLDSLFSFKNGNIHWAWGNHDLVYGNQEYLEEVTGKPGFYFSRKGSLGIMVLNTNLFYFPGGKIPPERCLAKDAQLAMIRTLVDTVENLSHLVVLHHHSILSDTLSGFTIRPDSFFNASHPEYWVSCSDKGTFTSVMYPIFKKIKEKGVEVVFIGGDVGMHAKRFEYQNPDGIWFLGSGINNSVDKRYLPDYVWTTAPDEILFLTWYPESAKLKWEFRLLGGD